MTHRFAIGATTCILLLFVGSATAGDDTAGDLAEWQSIQTVDDRDKRADWWAAATLDELNRFLEAGADVNIADRKGWTPLHSASRYNQDSSLVQALLDAGADPHARNRSGDTALHWAAAENPNVEILSILLDSGANVNARDDYGWSPIHLAAERTANPLVVKRLLEAGAEHKRRIYFVLFRPAFLAKRNRNLDADERDAVVAMLKAAG